MKKFFSCTPPSRILSRIESEQRLVKSSGVRAVHTPQAICSETSNKGSLSGRSAEEHVEVIGLAVALTVHG